MTRIAWSFSLCLALAFALRASGEDASASGDEALDRASVVDFLRGFSPDEQQRQRLASLLHELDAAEFAVRDAAMRELLRQPIVPPAMLDDAYENGSTEVRLAVRRLLRSQTPRRIETLLQEAYASISRQQYRGLCAEVLSSLRFAGQAQTVRSGQQALEVTVTRDDAATLRQHLNNASPVLRRTAAVALARISQDAAADGLLRLLDDTMPNVQLDVAVALGNAGYRESLNTLVDLLDSERLVIRWRSSEALRGLTGMSFGFRPAAAPADRQRAAQQWRKWLETHREAITLRTPVESPTHIDLFADNDLSNWVAFSKAGRVPPDEIWEVRDERLIAKPKQYGDLRTLDAFGDYCLSFEWRMTRGIGDSGVGVMLTDRDNPNPSYLEVQLHTDNAGDLYRRGSFSSWSRGQPIEFRATKWEKSNERHGGLWNHMEITVHGGDVRVVVNGVVQNEASRGPDKPGHILLRHEGSQVEFRHIHLVPLEF